MMITELWIVIIRDTNIIESVWSTERLAEAAIHLHAHIAKLPIGHYNIIHRELNTTWKPK